MKRKALLILVAMALTGCLGAASRSAFMRNYRPPVYQPVPVYRVPVTVYRTAPMVMPTIPPYRPPRQIYCTKAWDGMGGMVCR